MDTVEERVRKKTANVRQDSQNIRQPPCSSIRHETLGEAIVESKKRSLDSPYSCEEEIRYGPLISGECIGNILVIVGRLGAASLHGLYDEHPWCYVGDENVRD